MHRHAALVSQKAVEELARASANDIKMVDATTHLSKVAQPSLTIQDSEPTKDNASKAPTEPVVSDDEAYTEKERDRPHETRSSREE